MAGTGRSGTSTVAGILRRLGMHVPQPEVVADATNPRGFGEPRWVVDFHDELLGRSNVQVSDARPVAWQRTRTFAERPSARNRLDAWLGEHLTSSNDLLIKDPRLVWFLPLWTAVARDRGAAPVCLTMLRPPPEVVGSKRASYNARLADGHGVAAWVNLMLNTELATRGLPRSFVRYHDLLRDWRPVIDQIRADLGLTMAVDEAAAADIDAFVDPTLRRIDLTWDDLDLPDRLKLLADETWTCLDALAGAADTPAVLRRLDEVRGEYATYYEEAEVVSRSTVVAARSAARAEAQRELRADGPPRPPGPSLAVRSVRRPPKWMRRLVPRPVRERVMSRLSDDPAGTPGGAGRRP